MTEIVKAMQQADISKDEEPQPVQEEIEETKDAISQSISESEKAKPLDGRLQVLIDDPYLGDFEQDLLLR